MMKHIRHDCYDRDYVLGYFGEQEGKARAAYLLFLEEEMGFDRESELSGGGFIRSSGGWSKILSMKKQGLMEIGDERILGDGDFVTETLAQAEKEIKTQLAGVDQLELVKQDIEETCRSTGISVACFRSGNRRGSLPQLKRRLARKFIDEYGLSLAEIARQLGVPGNAVSSMVRNA